MTYAEPIEETLGDFIKNSPYRDVKKIKSLVKQKFNVDLTTEFIEKYIPKLNNFDVQESKKTYQLKTISLPYTYMGDIFFPYGKKVAFLLLIEVNTRKAFGYQLGNIEEKEIINVDSDEYERTILAPTTGLKTTISLIRAFNKFLQHLTRPIKHLKFDGESGINNSKFQEFLTKNNITFTMIPSTDHNGLSLINRLCRTLRDIAFNMNVEIVDQNIMNKVLDNYNNAPHDTITKACFNNDYRLKILYPNGISPNNLHYGGDMGICPKGVRYLERLFMMECLKYNYIVSDKTTDLNLRDKCRIYEEPNKFDKKRSKLSKDVYQILGLDGKFYQCQNIRTGEMKNVPRAYISIL